MAKFTEERLYKIRRLRQARRLWAKSPIFAYTSMLEDFPGYSYAEFVDDLKRRSKKKNKAKKNHHLVYGRYGPMRGMLEAYRLTGDMRQLIGADRLYKRMTRPYMLKLVIKGEIRTCQLSPKISYAKIDQLISDIGSCSDWESAEALLDKTADTSCGN